MIKKYKTFDNKVVLVTGGTGSIGSEIVKQLLTRNPKQIRVYARDEFKHFLLQQELSNEKKIEYIVGDIRDPSRVQQVVNGCDFIFHTAAMKHISFCENNPIEAIKTNIIGSQNILESAIKSKVSNVIAISTDKAANPTTFMGKTKQIVEGLFTSQHPDWENNKTIFSVVRLGNIMNSKGSVVPLWIDQIHKGLDITLTDKRMTRYLMEVDEAARLIIEAGLASEGREIFVIKMQDKNIYNLANEVINKYGNGKKIGIKIIGRRYGEKLREELLTKEEKSRSIETKNYYIILPNKKLFEARQNTYEQLS